jgi:hypothetical protein
MGLAVVIFSFFLKLFHVMKNFIAASFATLADDIEEKDQNEIRVGLGLLFQNVLFKNSDLKMSDLKNDF